jgi:exosortase/archaeosortase family protein
MIGLLFGELKRLSISRRGVLVAGAVAIALFANFVRAVFLVQVAATENISEITRWHDVAGYSIVALVFVGTFGLAYLLGNSEGKRKKEEGKSRTVVAGVPPKPKPGEGWSPAESGCSGTRVACKSQPTPVRLRSGQALPLQIPAFYLAAALCWLLFIEVSTAAWYRVHETNLVSGIRWTVRWPEQAPNFHKLKIDEEIRSVLRFDEGQGAAWTITSQQNSKTPGDPQVFADQPNRSTSNKISCLLYVFRWKPGRNSALLANLHRPDVCLPASGWTQVADDGVRNYPVSGQFELPFRHFEFQRAFENTAPQTAHAFYCLSEDRASGSAATPQGANLPGMSGSRSEWTRAERLRAVSEGRRHLGQQVIQAIFISSEPFSAADAESLLRDLVRDVVVLQ